MKIFRLFLIPAAVTFFAVSAAAKEEEWPMDWLLGIWHGEGQLMRAESRTVLEARRVLDGHFLELSYRADMAIPDGESVRFEGRAFYRNTGDGRWEGSWADSGGELHPLAGTLTGKSLQTIWGTPVTKLGRVTYRLMEDGRLEVVDEIMTSRGGWQEFGRNIYIRRP